MNLILEDLLNKGFKFIVSKSDHTIKYTLEGFYKSGAISLYEAQESLWAESRYNQIDEINSFEDLVLLNYDWWIKSKDRSDGWNNPHEDWIKYFIEMDLIKKKININYYPNSI